MTTLGAQLDDVGQLIEYCFEQGWTDGLPVVPPTRAAVDRMLAGTSRGPQEVIALVPPKWGQATVERIAANAVMAGCQPAHMPVIIAALDALMDDRFNLHGVQCTTHVATPLVVVNGPLAQELGFQGGHNCFGQGFRANAAVGRAVRLILSNIGGALPGVLDKATFGHPGKFSYCVAENEAASPWEPYHVSRGFAPTESTVTVFAAEAPHNINNHGSNDPYSLLYTVANTMNTLGSNNIYLGADCFLVFGPEHAEILARDGWRRSHIQSFLYEHARRPIRELKVGGMYGDDLKRNLWPRWINRDDENAMVPVVREKEDIQIFVAGGAGRHSLFIPGWGTRAITRKITL